MIDMSEWSWAAAEIFRDNLGNFNHFNRVFFMVATFKGGLVCFF